MNKSFASNFLHMRHSQVSKQRIQGLFLDFVAPHLKRKDLFFCLLPAVLIPTSLVHALARSLVAFDKDGSPTEPKEEQHRYM